MATLNTGSLRTANSLGELGTLARALRLYDALDQPLPNLCEHAAMPTQVRSKLNQLLGHNTISVGDFLQNRAVWRVLKATLSPQERKDVLNTARQLLEAPAPPSSGPARLQVAEAPAEAANTLPNSWQRLEKWANERGIPEALDAPLTILAQSLGSSRFRELQRLVAWHAPIGVLLCHDHPQIRLRDPNALLPFRPAARSWLVAQEAEVRRACEEETAREQSGHRPSLPEAQPLWDRLSALRAHLRKGAAPTSRAVLSLGELFSSLEPLKFRWKDPRPVASYGTRLREPSVLLPLETKDEHLHTQCDVCAGDATCRHRLAAVDRAMQWLAGEPDEALRTFIAETAATPWERTLRFIQRASVAPESDATAGARLVWRLSGEGRISFKLKPVLQTPSKRGGYTIGTSISVEEILLSDAAYVTAADRRAANVLASHRHSFGDSAIVTALTALAGAGLVQLEKERERLARIREVKLGIRCVEQENGYALTADADGLEVVPSELVGLGRHSRGCAPFLKVDKERSEVLIVTATEATLAALDVLATRGAAFPKEAADKLVDTLEQLPVPLRLPAPLEGERVQANTRPLVALSPLGGLSFAVEPRIRALPGMLPLPVGEGPAQVRGREGDRRVVAERRLEVEREQAMALWSKLGLPPLQPGASHTEVEGMEALEVVRRLEQEAASGTEVLWPPQKPRFSRPAVASDLSMKVREGRDWFGLTGAAEVDGHSVEMARLLEAARRRHRYVQVSEDQFVELSETLAKQLLPVAELVFDGKQGTEISLSAAPVLEALAEEVAQFEASASFRSLTSRIRAAGEITAQVPTALRATLRPYQREGFEWMARLAAWGAGACLADDMGLGKTVQALTLLLERQTLGPALVVAPTSVCFNWQSEAATFAPGLKVHRYHEVDREQALANLGPGEVVVTSYGLLTRDLERFKAVRFGTIVLDEAQAIKNAASLRARAVRELNGDFRVALTGTPLENHLGELWSLFRFLMPGLLGSEDQFRERFWGPIERTKDPSRKRSLARIIQPFVLRRTKALVATELPPRIDVNVPVVLSAEERRLYDEARLAAAAELAAGDVGAPEQKRFRVLAALTRLRLLACHPALHDPTWTGPASKLARVLELVDQLREEGHRTLIFSQFTQHLAIVRAALEERGVRLQYLDGGTPEAERRHRVEAFQAGEGEVFLISLKAGGTGLNLTGADNVIHLDPWWNPAVEDQASDRAHRIGQTKTVTVYRILTRGTIEEAILALHADKRELAAGLLDGTGEAARMGTEDLVALLESASDDEDEESGYEDPAVQGTPQTADDEVGAVGEPPPAALRLVRSEARAAEGASAPLPARDEWADLVARFQEWLTEQHEARRIGPGPVKSYPRAVERFGAWLATQFILRESRPTLDSATPNYLEALKTGQYDAPKSEPILARSALKKFGAFLLEERSTEGRRAG